MEFDLGKLLKDVPNVGTGREQIEYIHLDLIEEDPNNFYQLSGIEELAANIELCGLQQPIRVRPIPDSDRYRIVSGHRRRKAVEALAQDDPERWSEIPCIIETDDASPALQQLRLIYANANTRTMTSAEVSEQAVQVEKLLYQLKEDGYEFPGRMRDHVAQAVGASKSKLARLKVIRDNLAFSWKTLWKANKLGESVAYELAQLNPNYQEMIFAATSNTAMLYAGTVQEYAKRLQAIEEMRCGSKKDTVCLHKMTMQEKSVKDRWQDPCRSHCCLTCASLTSCKSSCEKAAGKRAELKAAAKADAAAYAQKVAEREKPSLDMIRGVYARVGEARAAAGVSIEALYESQGKAYSESVDAEKYLALENGTAKINTNTTLPFGWGFYVDSAKRLVAVADLLQVSTDYLLGREEKPASASDTAWRTGNPEAYGTYVAYVEIAGSDKKTLRELLWDGEEWYLFGNPIDENVTVCSWADRPEV